MKNKLNELETLLNKKCNDECSNCNYKRECEEYTKLSYKKENDVKYPCRNCEYFKICGNTNRTQKCNGRKLKDKKITY